MFKQIQTMKKGTWFILMLIGLTGLTAVILYIMLFGQIEPSYKEFRTRNMDYQLWNADHDPTTIETYYLLEPERMVLEPFRGYDQFLRSLTYDKKKYKTQTDSFYFYTYAADRIIGIFDLAALGEIHLTDYHLEIDSIMGFICKYASIKDKKAAWPMHFKFMKYGMDYGWFSGHTQGRMLSAIARVYEHNGDMTVYDLGTKAVDFCFTSIENGGFCNYISDRECCFEEYPMAPASSVLNGHIICMLGLYDFYRVTSYQPAFDLFEKGMEYLRNNLKTYDLGYWSRYDALYSYSASYFYHKMIHIPQLRVLYAITHEPFLDNYASKWEENMRNPDFCVFKLKALIDAIDRRFVYKSWFNIG